jgi:uncharacterized LabA/DUF88 family protein
VTDECELLRAYYYDAVRRKESNETNGSDRGDFLETLDRLPRFEVKLGKFAERQGESEQKRVDVMLALDLILLVERIKIDRAAILTGDSDFIPAIQFAKDAGVEVHLYSGKRENFHKDLWGVCDERTMLEQHIGELRYTKQEAG